MATNKVNEKEIVHTVKLAKLELNEDQKGRFVKQLENVFSYVQTVQSLDTSKVKPTAQVTGLKNVFRKDEIIKGLSQQDALKNAPRKLNGFIVVKNVFEE